MRQQNWLSLQQHRQKGRDGFTLIEILVAVGISLAILAFLVANFYRGGDDSALNREVNLLMSRIRLAQEYTQSGKEVRHCSFFSGKTCSNDADCTCSVPGTCEPYTGDNNTLDICLPVTTPKGGYGVVFSCPGGVSGDPGDHTSNNYPLHYYATTGYGFFAEDISCHRNDSFGVDGCFPARPRAVNPSFLDAIPREPTNGFFSYFEWGQSGRPGYRGDTLQELYRTSTGVEIKDIRLTSQLSNIHSCNAALATQRRSPWDGKVVPNTNGSVATSEQPLQAAVIFPPPPNDRELLLNDNIALGLPDGSVMPAVDPNNTCVKVEVMLGLSKRNSDCHVVEITRAGVVSRRVDADCEL